MEGGYSAVARELSRRFELEPPLDRRWIRTWNTRRTLNRLDQPFPSPVRAEKDAKPTQPRLIFDVDAVAAWFAAGVPARWGAGWETPAERNERYANPTRRDLAIARAARRRSFDRRLAERASLEE